MAVRYVMVNEGTSFKVFYYDAPYLLEVIFGSFFGRRIGVARFLFSPCLMEAVIVAIHMLSY